MLSLMVTPKGAKLVQAGHPWIYRDDIAMTSELELAEPGELVAVLDTKAKPLGVGYFNPNSVLACRLLSLKKESADEGFFSSRFAAALKKREAWYAEPYYRLVHSEGDDLPGLVIDRFGDVLVVQVTTAGMERLQSIWLAALEELLRPVAVVFRNDTSARKKEGLPQSVEVKGTLPAMPVEVHENGVRFLADLITGQKTGWFFDQRDNRAFVAAQSQGKSMVDIYSHTGGFGLPAAVAGARQVTMVDASASALSLSRQAAERNRLKHCDWVEADVFELLPRWLAEGKRFEVVMADPPAFIKDKRNLHSGLKGYEKLAKLACQLTAEGGLFVIASCSHHAGMPLFRKAVEQGLRAAGRKGTHVYTGGAGKDHPVHPMLKENQYLKALGYRME